jgi:hypothetical protein
MAGTGVLQCRIDASGWADALPAATPTPAPWFAPWQPTIKAVRQRLAAGEALHAALDAEGRARGAPVGFVPQQALPAGQAYEDYIFKSKRVPVRAGLHDFFNGICWLGLPGVKARMNALQAAEIAARGVGATRGPVRDALTVLDENGAFLYAPEPLWDALAARAWSVLFGALRPLWAQTQLLVFGHAALEKLVRPYKSITVHVWRVRSPWSDLRALEAQVVPELLPERLAAKPFAPLPVLGVPLWWPANADPGFYDDPAVFRPARARPASG